jgi:two-component system sensor histidine kinase PilS (NtrC family)
MRQLAFGTSGKFSFRLIFLLRLFSIIILLGLSMHFLTGIAQRSTITVILISSGLTYFLSLLIWLRKRERGFSKGILYPQFLFDVALVSTVVYYSGGIQSGLIFLYVIPIIWAGLFFSFGGGAIIAAFSSLALSGIVFANRFGLTGPGNTLSSDIRPDVVTVINWFMFFFLFSLFSGYLVKRRELEEVQFALEEVKLDTNAILRNLRSGILVVNSSRRILYFNQSASEILETRRSRDGGFDLDDLRDSVPVFVESVDSILQERTSEKRLLVEIDTTDDQKKPVGLSASPLLDKRGRKKGTIIIFQDLTEEKKLERRMRSLDRLAAIGEFAASLAHEIRTPLTAIRGSVELLNQEEGFGESTRRLFGLVIKESDRLNRTVTDFLTYARPPKANMASINLAKVLDEAIAFQTSCRPSKNGRKIRTRIRDNSLMVTADRHQLFEMFGNLTANALDAIGDHGELEVSLIGPEGHYSLLSGARAKLSTREAAIVFSDSGSAMTETELDQIFEPFFTTKPNGTGLGLSIVRRVIDMHGGELKVDSKPGTGTVFVVILPCGSK